MPRSTTPVAETQAIPFLDLVTPHRALREELLQVAAKAIDTAGFIGGPMVAAFEAEFAQFCGVKHCLGVGSGTDALRFALAAVGVRNGTSVITVPNSFVATTAAITQAGGHIEFVDVDPATCLMDPNCLESHLRKRFAARTSVPRPVAVVPVHLYGQCADMDAINEIARRYELKVVEDAAQAHGALDKGRKAGSLGDVAAFSFYPGKNLGACGEGGAVTTNSQEIADHVALLRDHGRRGKYEHVIEGYNGRLDAIQAGMLSVKLRHLDRANALRRERAAQYDEALADVPWLKTIALRPGSVEVRHLYVIRTTLRDQLRDALADQGIATGIHYPIPLHLQECYKRLGLSEGRFPHAEACCRQALSLPMYPELSREAVYRVVAAIRDFGVLHSECRSCDIVQKAS